ncbi:MAG: glutamine amidotransferase, partial [Terriglobales bacterium]
MFELLFKYPLAAYQRGHLVLLAAWPGWLLVLAALAAALGLGWLLRQHRGRRTAVIWALQSAVIALLLLLLWQPALSLAQLKPQQNIVAVLVDDSRSMNLPNGLPSGVAGAPTRAQAAAASLNAGLLDALARRFQVRLYTFDNRVRRAAAPAAIHPDAAATRFGDSLNQFLDQTADLPIGAVVLLSDGADNSGGLDRATLDRLRARHLPVHTVGFGVTTPARDLELEDIQLQPRALAKARLQASVSMVQHGYAGQSARLVVRQGGQTLATQSLVLGRDGDRQTVEVQFNAGEAGAKTLEFALAPLPGEASNANNSQSRLLEVASAPRRILYIEGEPRWEYKFIRRAEASDPQVRLVSMLRATENKIYRQGISDPSEL